MAIKNIALGKTAGASGCVKPYDAARAVNGLQTPINRWLCNGVSVTTPAKLTVDLGGPSVITSWTLKHMGVAGWRSPDYNMCDYQLQLSNDGAAWASVDSVANNSASVTSKSFSTLLVARYARLCVTRGLRTNPQLASVMEFEIYGQRTPYLSALTVSSSGTIQALTPAFAPSVFNYSTANVPNSTASVKVIAIPQDTAATVKINGTAVTNVSMGLSVSLNVGGNAINVLVTAADGSTQTYTVTVVRDAAADAHLTGLTLTTTAGVSVGYTPNPFAGSTLAYAASVGYDVDKIVVTPTTDIAGSTITVNGAALVSGSATVNLAVGANAIPVVVTSGGATKTYTVTVTRAAAPVAYLTGLALATVGSATVAYVPSTFDKDTIAYTASVGYDVNQIVVTPSTTIVGATITVNGGTLVSGAATVSLVTGNNPISIVVTNGAASKSYTITVTRSSNTHLKKLIPNRTLVPGFSEGIFAYAVNPLSTIPDITIIPTLQDTAATMTINGVMAASGASKTITLSSGVTTITISISPVTGTVPGVYVITVTNP